MRGSRSFGWRGIVATTGVLAAAPALAQTDSGALEEIVVTATRRSEALQDVPVAVTALTAEALTERDVRDYGTYLASVPGAAYQETTGIGGEVKFRGVGTGINAQLSPTTAVYFGETPVIHSGRNVNSSYNFFLSDIERVEVLRGPQGTLYGSNSLGGAIKNVPAAPRLGTFNASVELSGGTVEDGGNDYSVQGMLNIPLGSTAAARLVAYKAEQAGWYDNVFSGGPRLGSIFVPPPPPLPPGVPSIVVPGQALPAILALQPAAANYSAPDPGDREDTNSVEVTGGRAILEWQASDQLTATLMAVYEQKDYGGAMFAEYPNALTFPPGCVGTPPVCSTPDIDYKSYEHYEGATGAGGDKIELFNLVVDYDFGGATLTSSTSYWERTEELDLSLSISAFPITGIPESIPIVNYREDHPEVLTQELRLTSNDEGRVDWLAGLFWQRIDQDHRIFAKDLSGLDLVYYRQVAIANFFGAPPPGTRTVANNDANFKDEQLAAFGQLGFDITSQWHAAVSARWFTLDQEFVQTSTGFQFGVAQGFQSGKNDEDVFTPRVEVSYKPEEGRLWYVSASEGFRTGIINRQVPLAVCGAELAGVGYPAGLPPTKADTVRNYELGAKFDISSRLRLNAAVYHIDWSDMQLNVALSAYNPFPPASQCQYDAIINAGDATTQGAELELSAGLTDSVRLDAALSYTDAQFDTTIPQLGIRSGQKIPLTPDITSYIALRWDFQLGSLPTYVRGEWQYVGEKEPFTQDFPESQYPNGAPFTIGDYNQYNIRAGIDLTDSVTLQLFADNISNEFGITSANSTGGIGYPFVTTIRPRMYGASMRVRF